MNDSRETTIELEPERYELFEDSRFQFAVDRRGFLKSLGGGILVLHLLNNASAEQQPRGRRGGRGGGPPVPSDIAAWLHIGEDGKVTVYTGKAEVGQNIRTSLTQVVAEELHSPTASIQMVMADTQLTPFDMGTFGSRTTPDMSPRLRRTAAAAREMLIELAAEGWKTDRALLRAENGSIIHSGTGQKVEFGKLTKGQKLTKSVADDTAPAPPKSWTIAGHSEPKVDGRSFVTGGHQYASDIRLPGMLFGKILRAPSFGATLTSVELSGAKSIPGVIVIKDGDFVGVAAPSSSLATRALAAIKAEWKPGARLSSKDLYENLKSDGRRARGGRDGNGPAGGQVANGRESTGIHLEQTYTIAYIAHAPLEPRAAVARWEDGKLTVWTGSQRPFGVRDELTRAFGVAADAVRVIIPDTGAGYGGKHTGEAAVEAARLAKGAGKPVKLVWTREEEFTWAYFRPAGVIEVRSSASRDGVLTAWDFHNYNSGGSQVRSLYDIPNQKSEFHQVSSPLRQGSYRALAATANHFARESHMDELAHAAGLDPLAFRLNNLKGDRPETHRLRAVIEAAAKAFDWGKKTDDAHGIGIAGGSDKGSFVATCAEIAVDPSSGRVQVIRALTAFECGAIVNPDHLKNQVEGAMVMGIGGALFEAIEYEDGRITNPRFSRYRVPRFRDTPTIEVVLIDRKDLPSAGAGETPIVAIAPAIGNAIFNATGIRLRSLPMAPQGVKATKHPAQPSVSAIK
jgi:CO/xanthine dehydrogenase Mo-binding subunit